MNNLVKKIVEIEYEAHQVIEDAKKQKQEILQMLDAEVENMKIDLENMARKKINELSELGKSETKNKLESIEKETNTKLIRLDQVYLENGPKWVDEIVNKVIGR